MRLLSEAIDNPAIERLDLELESGVIIWTRYKDEICECDGCDGCADWWCDCQSDGELERFKQDTEDDNDFDLNDPRR